MFKSCHLKMISIVRTNDSLSTFFCFASHKASQNVEVKAKFHGSLIGCEAARRFMLPSFAYHLIKQLRNYQNAIIGANGKKNLKGLKDKVC